MKAQLFCSLFFLLAANEIVVDLAKGEPMPAAPPDLEFTIAGMVYPVDLNHNRTFTEEERCLLEAVMNKIQAVLGNTAKNKCQWLNNSLAEVQKCGEGVLANQMAHNTMEEMLYTCSQPQQDELPPVSEHKTCYLTAAVQHIHSLLLDDFQCQKLGVCQRCQVLKGTMDKLAAGCTKTRPGQEMMAEVARRFHTTCLSQDPPESTSPAPPQPSSTPFADPDFHKPLVGKKKCLQKAHLEELKRALKCEPECSRINRFLDDSMECHQEVGEVDQSSKHMKQKLHQACVNQEPLPARVLSPGEKCSLNAQIKHLQSLVDGDDHCSALKKEAEGLEECPTAVYAQYMLPHIHAQLNANCPEIETSKKEQETTSTDAASSASTTE